MLAAGIIFSILASVFGGHAVARQEPDNRLHMERYEVRTGYAWQYKSSTRPNNFQFQPLLLSAVIPLTGELNLGPDCFRGRIDWNPELFLAMFTHPYDRPLVGLTPLQLKYTFAPKGRFSPYVLLGSGVLYSNINRRETRSDINFNLNAGAGTYFKLADSTDLILEYRHIHISNAGIHEDNAGLNTHTFLAGVSIKR